MSPAENVCQRPIPVVTVLTILPQMPVVGSATEQKTCRIDPPVGGGCKECR